MIYADFNATTPLGASAKRAIERALEIWGNPSSAHAEGRKALEFLNNSRSEVAHAAGTSADRVVFTSGGSEANTLALLGACWNSAKPFRLVTSPMEHSSILSTVERLKKCDTEVALVATRPDGGLDLDNLRELLSSFRPTLVSLMTANNETGVVNPIREIAGLCREAGVPLHTDAVQALGKLSCEDWAEASAVSLSAHKIFGPKGAGALVLSPALKLASTHFGGNQETKRRGGTENMLGIAGFAGACGELASLAERVSMERLRNRFEARLKEQGDDFTIQGADLPRLPNTTNVRFDGVDAQVLLTALDLDGVCVSTGSACSSGSVSPSHVLLAMGLTAAQARECLRISWSKTTTESEVDTVSELMINHVRRIRSRRKAS